MRHPWIAVTSLALTALVGSGYALQDKAAAPALPNCPVIGDEQVNLAISTNTPEGPVYFCCKGCVGKYKANAAKFAEGAAAQRKALAGRPKVQVTCPACGHAADSEFSLDNAGQKVSFCSAACMDKYKADPAKHAVALANSYTYQTTCPVMGEPIDPKSSVPLANGARIYMCCNGCAKKLFADPETTASKLAAQGFVFKAKDIVPGKDDHGHEGHNHDH